MTARDALDRTGHLVVTLRQRRAGAACTFDQSPIFAFPFEHAVDVKKSGGPLIRAFGGLGFAIVPVEIRFFGGGEVFGIMISEIPPYVAERSFGGDQGN